MIAILSPAKNMRPVTRKGLHITNPKYTDKTKELVQILKEYNPWQLASLMGINEKLAMSAFVNYQDFDFKKEGYAAFLSYYGLAYQNVDGASFTLDDFSYANDHVRIISSLYGLLKPTDGILPHRLDFLYKLKIEGKSLYQFWGEGLYKDLFQEGQVVLNLASGEYSRAISPYLQPEDRMITCDFLSYSKGKLRILPTMAKMARGQMVRYIVKNRLNTLEAVKNFDWNGFEYSEHLLYENKFVFIQK